MLDQPPKPPKAAFSVSGFVIGLAVAGILAIVALFIWQRGGLSTVKEKFGADYSLAAVVAEQTAPLNVKPHTVELVTDKSKKAADALRRGDYQTAGRLADEVLSRI